MTNELAVFQYQAADVRVIRDEKGGERITTLGGIQEMIVLSEQGLYFFLGRSDKPAALPIQKWIAGEVLPSIRKTGGYSSVIPKTLPEALRLCAAEIEKRQVVEKRLVLAAPKIDFYDTVADSPDTIPMGSMAKMLNMYPPPGSRYRKDRPIGRNTLLDILRDEKILMQRGENKNIPYQIYMSAGLFRVEEREYYIDKYNE